MCSRDMYCVSFSISAGAGSCRICAMLCKPVLHVQEASISHRRRTEEIGDLFQIQYGWFHKEFTTRKRSLHYDVATNSRSMALQLCFCVYADKDLGFNEFVHERETRPANDPLVLLFDQIILAKKNRDRRSFFSKSSTSFLADTSDHLWRSASTPPPNSRFPGDYRATITRSRLPDELESLTTR